MCRCKILNIIQDDEQALFQVLYCKKHDEYFDGFGVSLEPKEKLLA